MLNNVSGYPLEKNKNVSTTKNLDILEKDARFQTIDQQRSQSVPRRVIS